MSIPFVFTLIFIDKQGGVGSRLHAARGWFVKCQRVFGLVENTPVFDNDWDFLAGWQTPQDQRYQVNPVPQELEIGFPIQPLGVPVQSINRRKAGDSIPNSNFLNAILITVSPPIFLPPYSFILSDIHFPVRANAIVWKQSAKAYLFSLFFLFRFDAIANLAKDGVKSPVRNVVSKPLLQHQSSRKSSGVS